MSARSGGVPVEAELQPHGQRLAPVRVHPEGQARPGGRGHERTAEAGELLVAVLGELGWIEGLVVLPGGVLRAALEPVADPDPALLEVLRLVLS